MLITLYNKTKIRNINKLFIYLLFIFKKNIEKLNIRNFIIYQIFYFSKNKESEYNFETLI